MPNSATLLDFDIAVDGRTVILNFTNEKGERVPIRLSEIELEKTLHELQVALTKVRQLSEVTKQGLVSYIRPRLVRGSAAGQDVVLSLQFHDGLELHYGLQPNQAERLSQQLFAAAQVGKKANPPTPN
jgi:hypothetical protein